MDIIKGTNPNIFFSIVIPALNEEKSIEKTVSAITDQLANNKIDDYEILIINDHSEDKTETKVRKSFKGNKSIRCIKNSYQSGFGNAVRKGIENFRGECICIVMADLSDSPQDIVNYYYELKNGAECVFGSRFIKGSRVIDYPKHKLIINRIANWFIKILFGIKYNDTTNAFKAYRRDVINGIQPILSKHFNLTVELPLKAIVRGYNYKIIPINWTNRVEGISKLKIKEMGSRYLFIVLYIFFEKILSKGDYRRKNLIIAK